MNIRQFSNEIERRMDYRGKVQFHFSGLDIITVEYELDGKIYKYGLRDDEVNMATAAGVASFFHKSV